MIPGHSLRLEWLEEQYTILMDDCKAAVNCLKRMFNFAGIDGLHGEQKTFLVFANFTT